MRKFISLLLAITLILSLSVTSFAQMTGIGSHWAEEAISYLVAKGVLSGYPDGTFRPDNSMTKAEFYKVINELLGFEEKAEVTYLDVFPTDWFFGHVAKALAAGYITPDTLLSPNEYITRQEVARIIGVVYNIDNTSTFITTFNDSFIISKNISGIIGTMVEKGILSGYPDGTFRPNSNITRAEVVTIINNVLNNLDDIVKVTTDKSELKALIGEAKDLDKDDYAKTTWDKLKEVLELAIEIFEDENAIQEEVDGILEKLEDAIDNIKKVSKSSSSNERDDDYIPSRPIKYATTAEENFDITVNYGTEASAAKAKLATTVEITGSKSEIGTAAIEWKMKDYDGNIAGAYQATGVLTLPANWTGTAAYLTATVTVNEAPKDAEFLTFINKYSEILNRADEDIDISHIRAIGELTEDLSNFSEKNIDKFMLEYGERYKEIEDICLIHRWTRDVQLTNDEANMRELFNLLAPLKLDDTNVFDSLSDIQQTEIAKFFILSRPEETELSQELFNVYTELIGEKTLNYLEILNNINNGSYNTKVTEVGALGELLDIELYEEEIHMLIVLTPPEGYESISQIKETLESLESIEFDYTIEGKEYLVSFEAMKENALSTLTVDSYEIITGFLSWLDYGLSPEAYNYIDGDSIRTELNNMMNDLMDYILEEFTHTTDIDIISELTAKVFGWYSLEVKTKLDDLSRLFILVRDDIVTYEFSDLNQVEEILAIADEIMWDVIEAANYAENIEELRTLLDEYISLTSTDFSDAQLENILTNPLKGGYFELTEVLIAAAGDIEEGLRYLQMFEAIMEYELSTIEIRDYFDIEMLLNELDELNMDSYNYIDGDAIREILNELMDEALPLVESALSVFSNSNDADIISETAQQTFRWYSDPIMFDDLSYIFMYLRDASGLVEYTDLEEAGDMLWAASEIMEEVIDTTNAAANIEELREGLQFYIELTSTEFEDEELENILANRPLEGYESLTEVLNGAAYR